MLGKEVLKIEEISYVFSNIEVILEAHQNLLKKLKHIAETDWPHVRGVGKAILDSRKGFSAYGVYVGNFVNSQDTVTRLSEKNGRFSIWLQEVEAKHGDSRGLQFLLGEPIHHITKMEGCLGAMVGYLPTGREEREVVDAYTVIYETDKFVKDMTTKSENNAISSTKRMAMDGG